MVLRGARFLVYPYIFARAACRIARYLLTRAEQALMHCPGLQPHEPRFGVLSRPRQRRVGSPSTRTDRTGKNHLRKLGQTTKLERSTLDQVRAKIAELRERTAAASEQKAYDFDERIREIREAEKAARLERKAKKRRTTIEDAPPPDDAMAAMMGFSSFA